MRRRTRLGMLGALLLALAIPVAAVNAAGGGLAPFEQRIKPHDLPHPLGSEQRALHAKAMEMKVEGKFAANAKVGKVGKGPKGQWVELAREGEESILTMLGTFDDLANNEIPEPDRTKDNSTIWDENFDRAHYLDLLFSETPGDVSMRNFYVELSSNRYTVNGDVTDWATAPQPGLYYNDDINQPGVCGAGEGNGTWAFLRDVGQQWWNGQIASGKTPAQLNAYLADFDVWDRYDADGDSKFNEADGYIDHFQSVHAGMGEEVGGGVLGPGAIWSHRWYACFGLIGSDGPPAAKLGGLKIGGSNYWIGDYTVEPENGGVGVFAHEYAHDLGIPDLYDTAGAENSTGFWTLMSSGSYGNDGTVDIGSKPIHMGAWEKFQLNWLNYEVAVAGSKSEHKLGPATSNTKQAQGLFVLLPDKHVTTVISAPFAGGHLYYSGAGDDLDNTMSRSVTLPGGAIQLKAKVKYSIETNWDYAYLTVNGTPVATNRSTNLNQNGQNFGNGITGSSGGAWVDLTADLSAFAGQTVTIGFRYWTDTNTGGYGFLVDNLEIPGQPLDGAESTVAWTYGGFKVSTGTEESEHFNAYVVENRQYTGYDLGLKTGPYNFGFLSPLNNYVERFPYQDGVLISYWDSSFTNNSTLTHPGGGLILPIDAHPEQLLRPDGAVWRARVQSYDSTFGTQATDAITLHRLNAAVTHPSLPAVPVFDDRKDYWRASNPVAGVQNPHTGTQIAVKSMTPGGFALVEVRPAK